MLWVQPLKKTGKNFFLNIFYVFMTYLINKLTNTSWTWHRHFKHTPPQVELQTYPFPVSTFQLMEHSLLYSWSSHKPGIVLDFFLEHLIQQQVLQANELKSLDLKLNSHHHSSGLKSHKPWILNFNLFQTPNISRRLAEANANSLWRNVYLHSWPRKTSKNTI